MLKFARLIQNENMKIFRRVGTWVMVGLLVLVVASYTLLTQFNQTSMQNQNWQQNLERTNQEYQAMLQHADVPDYYQSEIEKEITINQYRLDHNIPPTEQTLWGFMTEATDLTSLITLFTIIVGAISVAGEFSWGTIKLLLIRSVSRSKILLSKYLASFLFALAMLAILFITSFIGGGLLYGFSDATIPHLSYADGQVKEKSMLLHVIGLFGLASVKLLMMATFAFMISSVFRSSALAIGLSIFLMFAGTQITFILAQMGYDWVKYLLFANTELSYYLNGTPPLPGMTLPFSITVLAVHFILFQVISWISFNKRDVTA